MYKNIDYNQVKTLIGEALISIDKITKLFKFDDDPCMAEKIEAAESALFDAEALASDFAVDEKDADVNNK